MWKEICTYLEHFAKGGGKTKNIVVDVAAGYCDFINQFNCGKEKYAIDMNPDIKKYAAKNVKAIVDNIDKLSVHFKSESVSLFFMSNFLEHISKEQISSLLETEYSLLETGGQVWILTPNIRYVGAKYWDFYDHITPITEKALMEEAESLGFKIEKCIPQFLPYTTKSRFPQMRWLVHLYLKMMPLSGRIFGQQSFLILSK